MGKGFTDKAAIKDDFEISRYIKGLKEFILSCDTPMTIAVQGDWGSGKTSMMQMVQKELGTKSVETVWFNTWQYSQFNLDKELTISFMKDIVNKLDVKNEEAKKGFNESISKVGRFVKTGLSMLIDSKIGGKTAEVFEAVLGALSGENGDSDAVQEIKVLRDRFEECVDSALDGSGKDRLVVFVDDLDRLNPGKAVELLEVLKLFLDCEKCVFILAIDYAVVTRGVKDKYGSDFDEEKGRSFFDKIIQVPFKMPVAEYDIKKYVANRFTDVGIPFSTNQDLEKMTNLIQSSIGNNPRSMKRLFNSYLLLSNVIGPDVMKTEKSKQLMFAILCMQSRYEQAYNYLSSHQAFISVDLLDKMTQPDSEIIKDMKLKEKEIKGFTNFAVSLSQLIDQDGKGGIDEEELRAFKESFRYSTITATNADSEPTEEQRNIRWAHRDRCIAYGEHLSDLYRVPFEDHFYKGKNLGSWRMNCVNRGGHKLPDGELIKIDFQVRFDPAKYVGKSTAEIKLKIAGDQNLDRFYEILGENPLEITHVKPVRDWEGYVYSDVVIFDSEGEDEKVFKIIDDAFSKVAEYFR